MSILEKFKQNRSIGLACIFYLEDEAKLPQLLTSIDVFREKIETELPNFFKEISFIVSTKSGRYQISDFDLCNSGPILKQHFRTNGYGSKVWKVYAVALEPHCIAKNRATELQDNCNYISYLSIRSLDLFSLDLLEQSIEAILRGAQVTSALSGENQLMNRFSIWSKQFLRTIGGFSINQSPAFGDRFGENLGLEGEQVVAEGLLSGVCKPGDVAVISPSSRIEGLTFESAATTERSSTRLGRMTLLREKYGLSVDEYSSAFAL